MNPVRLHLRRLLIGAHPRDRRLHRARHRHALRTRALVLEVTAAGLIKPASVFDVLRTDAYDFEALALKEGQTELGQASVKLRDRIIVESFVVFQVVLYLAQQVYEYRKTKKATGSAMAYLKSWYERPTPRHIRTTTGLSYYRPLPPYRSLIELAWIATYITAMSIRVATMLDPRFAVLKSPFGEKFVDYSGIATSYALGRASQLWRHRHPISSPPRSSLYSGTSSRGTSTP